MSPEPCVETIASAFENSVTCSAKLSSSGRYLANPYSERRSIAAVSLTSLLVAAFPLDMKIQVEWCLVVSGSKFSRMQSRTHRIPVGE
jgi:hypothetical protein